MLGRVIPIWTYVSDNLFASQFPYPAPSSGEPTKALKALIYIRKETLKLVRVPETKGYNIEFTFDADSRCQITIMYFCREELTPAGVV